MAPFVTGRSFRAASRGERGGRSLVEGLVRRRGVPRGRRRASALDVQPAARRSHPEHRGRGALHEQRVPGYVFLIIILTFGEFLANFERLVLGCIEAEFCM